MSTARKHIVAYPIPTWGHCRPLISLASRLVKMKPVTITILTIDMVYDRVKTELARNFEPGEEEAASYVTVVSIGEVMIPNFKQANAAFDAAYKSLIEKGVLVCGKTGTAYTLEKPSAIVLDYFATAAFQTVKELTGDTIKTFAWYSGLVAAMFPTFGPPSLGGPGNLRKAAEKIAQDTGRTFEQSLVELMSTPKGSVLQLPSLPPVFDYELSPQDWPKPEIIITNIFADVFKVLDEVDGVIAFTPECYEPEAIEAMKKWYGEKGRGVYTCGPLLPSASRATADANEYKLSKESAEIQAVLDDALAKSGKSSLLYISFGSQFWPYKTPENMWAFLDVVMELNIPFILSHAARGAVIPDEVKEKVNAFGKGVLTTWAPQQLILDHAATGWMVTHGGQNGVLEAISAGVPQIFWPFAGDQPLNAILIAETHKLGYELLEVRTGYGLKPIHRTGYTPSGTIEALQAEARDVLMKAFGADGAEKRAKLQTFRKKILAEWDDGGASKRDMNAFVDAL